MDYAQALFQNAMYPFSHLTKPDVHLSFIKTKWWNKHYLKLKITSVAFCSTFLYAENCFKQSLDINHVKVVLYNI
jgi:hypothetical protein